VRERESRKQGSGGSSSEERKKTRGKIKTFAHPRRPCSYGKRRNFFMEARQRREATVNVCRRRNAGLGELLRTRCGDPVLSRVLRRTLRSTRDNRRALRRIISSARIICGPRESAAVLKDEQRRSCDGRFRFDIAGAGLLRRLHHARRNQSFACDGGARKRSGDR
jgi:hypothetical protein